MLSSISRQYIYLILSSLILFIFVLVFSFGVLIPAGKEYRVKRVELKKARQELYQYESFHDETLEVLKEMQSKNRRVITALDATFNSERFEKQNKNYFSSLKVSEMLLDKSRDDFTIYEVNTTSQMSSPKSFYDFLDSINKSDWIISIDFPIDFKRDGEMIKSSFKMKVYCDNNDSNSTASESVAK